MLLEVLDWYYENGSSKVQQRVKGNQVPKNAVAGGNGSYVTADSPQVIAKVRNVETGETRSVNMYWAIKRNIPTSKRMSEKRADAFLEAYQQAGPFEATDWNDWD